MATPNYKELTQKAFGPAVAGAPEIRHVQHLVGDFMAALAAPVTEVAAFKLKEGGDANALRDHISAFSSALSAASHAFAWGSCVDDPDTLVAMIGWPSVDVFPPTLILVLALKIVRRHTKPQRAEDKEVKSLLD
jgi:hypothetical protein